MNLGRSAHLVNAFSVLFPFIRTGMTDEYAENEKVFGRWQPRMLETYECAEAFTQLLCRSDEELNSGMFELMVGRSDGSDGSDDSPVGDIDVTWRQVKFNVEEAPLEWSQGSPRRFSTA